MLPRIEFKSGREFLPRVGRGLLTQCGHYRWRDRRLADIHLGSLGALASSSRSGRHSMGWTTRTLRELGWDTASPGLANDAIAWGL